MSPPCLRFLVKSCGYMWLDKTMYTRIFSHQVSLTRQAFLITPLHGSRSKTGKNITPKKYCYVIICQINVPTAGGKTSISHSSIVICERSVRSAIGGRNCVHVHPNYKPWFCGMESITLMQKDEEYKKKQTVKFLILYNVEYINIQDYVYTHR